MKQLIVVLIFVCLVISLSGVNVTHISPTSFNLGIPTDLRLEVNQGWSDISEVKLMYRVVGDSRWMTEKVNPETPDGPWLFVRIPAQAKALRGIEYYFEFILVSGNTETHPAIDPVAKAYVLQLVVREGQLSRAFIHLSDDATVKDEDGYILAVSFYEIADEIDIPSIRVHINGKDVSNWINLGTNTLIYRDERPSLGAKTAVVTAQLKNGAKIYSDTWVTNVISGSPQPKFPVNVRGSVNFVSNMYSYSDDNAVGMADDDAATWLDLYGNWKAVDFQTNILVSSREESNKQPVNRYTFGVQVPYWEAYLGDYSPSISQFTMNFKNLRGLYTRLNIPFLSLSWAHGEMVRKTTSSFISGTTPVRTGTFKQEAIAGRLQIGKESGMYVAFNAARYRDIKSSLQFDDFAYYSYEGEAVVDTIFTVTPQDNLVLSVDSRLSIPEQNIVLGIEAAASMYNRNTYPGSMTTEEIEDYTSQELPINLDEYSGIFVINSNVEPLIPSARNVAWNAYMRWYFNFFWDNLFNVSYSEVGQVFRSLGINYLQNDAKTISLSHQMNFKQYFFLNWGYNIVEDNLGGSRSETNSYNSIFAQGILRLPSLPYIKAAYFLNTGENKDNPDADMGDVFIPYQRNSNSLSVGIGYNFNTLPYAPAQVDVTWKGGTDDSKSNDVLTYDNDNTNVSVSIINKYTMVPLRTVLSFSTNTQDIKLNDQTNKNFSFGLNAEYLLWENKLKPYVQFRRVNLGGDQDTQSYNYYTFGLEAFPWMNTTVSTSLGVSSYTNDVNSNLDDSVTTWRLLLTQRF